jgi:hypothetical protein
MAGAMKYHPHTGQEIVPIGYRRNGAPIWPVIGASEDDDAGGDDTPPDGADADGDDSDEDDDSEDDNADDDKTKKKGKDDDEDDEPVVSKRKFDKTFARMQAADKRSSELQKQLDDLKANADVPAELKKDLAAAKETAEKLTRDMEKMTAHNRGLTIRLAALTLSGVPEWQNVETALKLADLSDIDVDEDGTVDKRELRAALKQLAKDHPYLVKAKKAGDAGNVDDAPSGRKLAGRRAGTAGTPDKEALKNRFSVLQRM